MINTKTYLFGGGYILSFVKQSQFVKEIKQLIICCKWQSMGIVMTDHSAKMTQA